MTTPRILFAAATLALLSTAALAVPPTADQVAVPQQAESGHHAAKMLALFQSPELRAAFKIHIRQATRGMSKADKKAYRKHELQKVRSMTDAEKAEWRKQLQAEWNALPETKREKIAQRMADHQANPHPHRHQGQQQNVQPDYPAGDKDMESQQDEAAPQ
jgi:hypothetical protein